MPLRLFSDNTGWDSCRESVRYTRAYLIASENHAALAEPVTTLLDNWTQVAKQRMQAGDELVDANAMVASLDKRLDGFIRQLITRLVFEDGGDRSGGLVKKYMPEGPQAVIRLGLESELKRVKRMHAIAKELNASSEVLAILAKISELEGKGQAAIEARVEATMNSARVSLRMKAWKEDANAVRRGIESELEKYAAANKLGRDYADAAFPATKASRTETEPESPASPP